MWLSHDDEGAGVVGASICRNNGGDKRRNRKREIIIDVFCFSGNSLLHNIDVIFPEKNVKIDFELNVKTSSIEVFSQSISQ